MADSELGGILPNLRHFGTPAGRPDYPADWASWPERGSRAGKAHAVAYDKHPTLARIC